MLRQFVGVIIAGVLFGLGTAARGDVTVSVVSQGTPMDSAGDVATGFTAYKVTLTAGAGLRIGGADFGGSEGSPNGFFGAFLQLNNVGFGGAELTTPVEGDTNSPGGLFSTDTHFLVPAESMVPAQGTAPAEDNNRINPPGSPADVPGADWGSGSFLTGTFGLADTARASALDLAYLVLPDGQSGTFKGNVTEVDSTGAVVGTTHLLGTIPVPEPGTAGLVGTIAMIGIARGRRRAGRDSGK